MSIANRFESLSEAIKILTNARSAVYNANGGINIAYKFLNDAVERLEQEQNELFGSLTGI